MSKIYKELLHFKGELFNKEAKQNNENNIFYLDKYSALIIVKFIDIISAKRYIDRRNLKELKGVDPYFQSSEVCVMTNPSPSIKNIMETLVPITRFNRGEASKIFEEVSETGVKIVLKNNVPVGVILAPEQYEAMVETLEDYALFLEAEKRLKNVEAEELISNEQVMKSLGISESDLEDVEVDIE